MTPKPQKASQEWSPAPGLERRPATPFSNARALAIQSYREQQRRERQSRRKPRPAKGSARLTPSAEADAKAEERWQRELRRKGRRTGERGRPRSVTTTGYIEKAKALRARLGSLQHRLADFPLSRFEGWEIDSIRDVSRAVTAVEVGAAKGPPRKQDPGMDLLARRGPGVRRACPELVEGRLAVTNTQRRNQWPITNPHHLTLRHPRGRTQAPGRTAWTPRSWADQYRKKPNPLLRATHTHLGRTPRDK